MAVSESTKIGILKVTKNWSLHSYHVLIHLYLKHSFHVADERIFRVFEEGRFGKLSI
jgi:hypothetical protein